MEIQIRTKLQDTWAQITEKLGDAWGRGLRYGLGPDQPDLPANLSAESGATRAEVMDIMANLADGINVMEILQPELAKITAPLEGELEELAARGAGYTVRIQESMDAFLAAVSGLGGAE